MSSLESPFEQDSDFGESWPEFRLIIFLSSWGRSALSTLLSLKVGDPASSLSELDTST